MRHDIISPIGLYPRGGGQPSRRHLHQATAEPDRKRFNLQRKLPAVGIEIYGNKTTAVRPQVRVIHTYIRAQSPSHALQQLFKKKAQNTKMLDRPLPPPSPFFLTRRVLPTPGGPCTSRAPSPALATPAPLPSSSLPASSAPPPLSALGQRRVAAVTPTPRPRPRPAERSSTTEGSWLRSTASTQAGSPLDGADAGLPRLASPYHTSSALWGTTTSLPAVTTPHSDRRRAQSPSSAPAPPFPPRVLLPRLLPPAAAVVAAAAAETP